MPKGGVKILIKLRENLFTGATIVGGGMVLFMSVKNLTELVEVITNPVYGVLFLLFMVTDFNRTPVGMGLTAGLGFAPVLCAFILFGGSAAVVVNVLIMLTGLCLGRSIVTVLFNTSCAAISTYTAVWVTGLVQEYPVKIISSNIRVFESLITYLSAYIIVSSILAGIRIYPRGNKRDFVYTGIIQAVYKGLGFSLAVFTALVYQTWGTVSFYMSCVTVATISVLIRITGHWSNQREKLFHLYQGVTAVNEALGIEELFDRTGNFARAVLNADFVWLCVIGDGNRDCSDENYVWAVDEIGQQEAMDFVVGLSQRKNAFLNKNRSYQWCKSKQHPCGVPLETVFGMPLCLGDEIIAEFGVGYLYPRSIDKEMLQMCGVFSSHLALSVDNALKYEQARFLAYTDPLTGAYNYRQFYKLITQMLENTRKKEGRLSLIFIDIDGFRVVNNTYGHQVGDEVLRAITEGIRASCREDDLVCRIGGDEFTVILPSVDKDVAKIIAARIKDNLSTDKVNIWLREPIDICISVSIGVATFPGDASDVDSLIRVADTHMYANKGKLEE